MALFALLRCLFCTPIIKRWQAKFEIGEAAVQAFHQACKAGTAFSAKAQPCSQVSYLSEADLKPTTVAGRANITRYARAMLDDFQVLHFKILDSEKHVKVRSPSRKSERVAWEELLTRLPGYYVSRFDKKNLTPDQKNTPYLVYS